MRYRKMPMKEDLDMRSRRRRGSGWRRGALYAFRRGRTGPVGMDMGRIGWSTRTGSADAGCWRRGGLIAQRARAAVDVDAVTAIGYAVEVQVVQVEEVEVEGEDEGVRCWRGWWDEWEWSLTEKGRMACRRALGWFNKAHPAWQQRDAVDRTAVSPEAGATR